MTPDEALRDIRGYASANRFSLSPHALLRARQRGASRADVRSALMNAATCEPGQQADRWEVSGTDLDGDDLKLVVVLEAGVLVVTLF